MEITTNNKGILEINNARLVYRNFQGISRGASSEEHSEQSETNHSKTPELEMRA